MEDPGPVPRPDQHSSNLNLTFDPTQPAVVATVTILEHLFRVTLATEEGVRGDLHPRLLHDFRVSIRRTRSILGEVKKVLPRESTKHFRREFSWLAGTTGPTRDLDVLLIKLSGYENALPSDWKAGGKALLALIEGQRHSAARSLAEQLDSDRYTNLRSAWPRFLESAATQTTEKNALRPILQVADKRISRARSGAVALAQAIGPSSPESDLHRLRIACKKLRYLLEFFRSLYPVAEVSARIGALEELQDVLGDLNDFSVQRTLLLELTHQQRSPNLCSGEALVAIERLQELLRELQGTQRQRLTRLLDGEALTAELGATPHHESR